MLRLEPIITRFVDDVLRALRAASLDDLRELLTGVATPSSRAPRAAPVPATLPRRRREAPAALPAAVARIPAPAPKVRRPAAVRAVANDLTEITDPEKLLALVLATPPRAATTEAPREIALLSDEPPASTERPTPAAKARLRLGESLARESGGGVVIRRAKRA